MEFVRPYKNKGVIITETKQDAEKLKKAVDLFSSSLTSDEPANYKARIVIVDLPISLSKGEVFSCLFEQNAADKYPLITLESFMTLTKRSHKSVSKGIPSFNYIIEVSASVRKALITIANRLGLP